MAASLERAGVILVNVLGFLLLHEIERRIRSGRTYDLGAEAAAVRDGVSRACDAFDPLWPRQLRVGSSG